MEQPKMPNEGKSEKENWEEILTDMGMPSEIRPEVEIAKEAGVELVSVGMETSEAKAIARRLTQEDPSNLFGGFANSIEGLVSLVETLRDEWVSAGLLPDEISIVIHSSCINGSDCVMVAKNGGNKYHYNTKHIPKYVRKAIITRLHSRGLNVVEK
mgnify:CR=1 FL=1